MIYHGNSRKSEDKVSFLANRIRNLWLYSPQEFFAPFVWSRPKVNFIFFSWCHLFSHYSLRTIISKQFLTGDGHCCHGQKWPEKTNFGKPAPSISIVHICAVIIMSAIPSSMSKQFIQCRFWNVIFLICNFSKSCCKVNETRWAACTTSTQHPGRSIVNLEKAGQVQLQHNQNMQQQR